jgi:hypothetical protein
MVWYKKEQESVFSHSVVGAWLSKRHAIGIAPTTLPLELHLQERCNWNCTYKRHVIGITPTREIQNWLLEVDGLTDKWNGGIPVSNWEGPLGKMDYDGLQESIPNAISRLSINLDPNNYDLSGMGPDEDVVGELHNWNDIEQEENILVMDTNHVQANVINKISLSVFCRSLVTHYSILFELNQIEWPKSKVGKKEML